MKYIFFIICLHLSLNVFGEERKYNTIKITDVKMGDIETIEFTRIDYSKPGDFIAYSVIENWKPLDKKYYKKLGEYLNNEKSYNDSLPMCYEPAFALKIKTKDSSYKIAICMACEQLDILKDDSGIFHSSINEEILMYMKALYFDCYILMNEVGGNIKEGEK